MESNAIWGKLPFAFALLTCLGGLTLASGTSNEVIPAIAIFFTIFGFVCVDWLRLFSLPAVVAYLAMGIASAYCIFEFSDLNQPGNHQLFAVSELLVCVQAILMLQRKTVRIFEQLAVFCLLELVVAAVFNDAMSYGLLLIPVCLVGLWSLALLSIATAMERVDQRPDANQDGWISVASHPSTRSMALAGRGLPNWVLFSFAPAVAIVTIFFFYALPRTTSAGQINNPGSAIVGFSDELRLEQIGQMGQSTQVAALVRLRRRLDGNPYQPIAGIYLRGAVLEKYASTIATRPGGRSSATWSAAEGGSVLSPTSLPPEYYPKSYYSHPSPPDANEEDGMEDASTADAYDGISPDAVLCQVTYKSSKSPSLFSIPPYYYQGTDVAVAHCADRWTLSRADDQYYFPRITYTFGTRAFYGGVQSDTHVPGITLERHRTRHRLSKYPDPASQQVAQKQGDFAEFRWKTYQRIATEFDSEAMPSLVQIGKRIVESGSFDPSDQFEMAKAFEQHFSLNEAYRYSLNLNADPILGMDPIEQFFSVDRRGHCQYFASALAMMLRSQGIPARLIVGYKTNEYDEIGGRFIARQSHAHAWVEALIDRQFLDDRRVSGVEPWSEKYWLRLDPTPAAMENQVDATSAGKVFDLAQNLWEGLVIDMDAEKQHSAISGNTRTGNMEQSYRRFLNQIGTVLRSIQDGRLVSGGLANQQGFPWKAAIFICVIIAGMIGVLRYLSNRWKHSRIRKRSLGKAVRPSLDFYASALENLDRIGIRRLASETPVEVERKVESTLSKLEQDSLAGPLRVLTAAFYQIRYRGVDGETGAAETESALNELKGSVDAMCQDKETADQKRNGESDDTANVEAPQI